MVTRSARPRGVFDRDLPKAHDQLGADMSIRMVIAFILATSVTFSACSSSGKQLTNSGPSNRPTQGAGAAKKTSAPQITNPSKIGAHYHPKIVPSHFTTKI